MPNSGGVGLAASGMMDMEGWRDSYDFPTGLCDVNVPAAVPMMQNPVRSTLLDVAPDFGMLGGQKHAQCGWPMVGSVEAIDTMEQ